MKARPPGEEGNRLEMVLLLCNCTKEQQSPLVGGKYKDMKTALFPVNSQENGSLSSLTTTTTMSPCYIKAKVQKF